LPSPPQRWSHTSGEDDYRDNGISRWDAYDAQALTIASVALGAAAVAVIVFALARRRSAHTAQVAALVAIAAWGTQAVAFIGNTVN
jgi:hypothetical protein